MRFSDKSTSDKPDVTVIQYYFVKYITCHRGITAMIYCWIILLLCTMHT